MSSCSQPTLPGEPAPGLAHGRGFGGPLGCPCPPPEPRARAAGVDHRGRAQVLPKVLQHVDDRRTHLARRPQRTPVVPVAPDAPVALRGAVDRSGAAPGQALDSARERFAPVRFDHEMNVIGLNREVDDAKVRSIGQRQGSSERGKRRLRSKRRQPPVATKCDEDRMVVVIMRSSDVPDARPPGVGLSTGSLATPSSGGRNRKVQLLGSPTCRLDLALFGAAGEMLRT